MCDEKQTEDKSLRQGVSKREFLRYSGMALATVTATSLALPTRAAPSLGKSSTVAGAYNTVIHKGNLSEKAVVEWLRQLRGKPFVEQSKFDVTAVLKIRANNEIYYVAGVNVENIELTVGTCAEEGALGAAVVAFGQHFEVLEGWVMGAPRGASHSDLACYPCGECRQRLAQYAPVEAPFHIISLDGEQKDVKTRAELLPYAFSFRDLEAGVKTTAALPLEDIADSAIPDETKKTSSIPYDKRVVRVPNLPLNREEIASWLHELHSDVRVSGADRRVIIRLTNGAYVAGVKMENAAYPSSTTAIQVAVAQMNALFGAQTIEEIWTLVRYRESDMNQDQKTIYPPISGAVLQVIYQFAASQDIPVNLFNIAGESRSLPLRELLRGLRTFSRFKAG